MRFLVKVCSLILVAVFYCGSTFAQNFIIKGLILKSNATERISSVQVASQKTHTVAISNDLGSFNITTSAGDTLLFSKTDYSSEKIAISNSNDLLVYLKPVIKLNEVVIKDKTAIQQQKEIVNSFRAKGLYFDGRPPLIIFNPISGSPLTGFHELLGKDATNERRFIRFSQNEQQAEAIDKRYTKEFVRSITHLSDDELQAFMDAYRPSYTDFKNWNDYQLRQYIKSSFEAWQKTDDKTYRD
jgi:hypothetical protein